LINLQVPKYHVYIEYAEAEKSGIRFNISYEELVRTFSTPFNACQPFWFMGKLLNPLKAQKTVVFWSYETADKLHLPNQENLVSAKDKKYLVDSIAKGKVKGAYLCTEKFLAPQQNTSGFDQSVKFPSEKRRVLVVCGSDDEMKKAVTNALTRLRLVPVVMCEEPMQGRKIVARFSDYNDVGFAIVLLSPDVFVYAKEDSPTKRKLRSQEDVIFNLGFLVGRLGEGKVLAFFKESENYEKPSFEGIKVAAFDDRDSWKIAVLRELSNIGYAVDGDRILK
jgi:predicted nucleotide-binding protein